MPDITSLMAGVSARALSPEDIHRTLTTGPGSGSVDEARTVTGDQAALHQEIVDLIKEQAVEVATGWVSGSGDAAANAATPVGQIAELASRELHVASEALITQTSVYQHARTNVVEMPENPGEPDFVGTAFPMIADHAVRTAEYEAAAERNIAVYDQYARVSGEIGQVLPGDYGTLRADTAHTDIVVTPGSGG